MISYDEFRKLCAIEEAEDNLEAIKETNRKLCERYPFLITMWDYDDDWNATPSKNYDYEWTFLDDIPIGWRKAFGIQMCEEIRNVLIDGDYLDKYRVVQTKEKFASLCWYDNGAPEEIYDKLQNIISKYEDISYHTCSVCGKPATKYTTGWICPFCDECYEKLQKGEL